MSWINSRVDKLIEVILVTDFDNPKLLDQISMVAKNSPMDVQISVSAARNPGGSRNIGISNASGTWICFWDSDDYPDLGNMLKLVSEAHHGEFQMAVGAYQLGKQKDLNNSKDFRIKQARNELDIYCDPGIWRMAFKRDFIGESRFLEIKMGEDQHFVFGLLSKQPNISFSKIPVYKYVMYEAAQLTKNSVAVSELPIAQAECIKMYKNSKSISLLVGIYKQSITIFKRTKSRTKIENVRTIFKFWLQNPESILKLPYCLLLILRHR